MIKKSLVLKSSDNMSWNNLLTKFKYKFIQCLQIGRFSFVMLGKGVTACNGTMGHVDRVMRHGKEDGRQGTVT
jgi:hypothetical protein